MGQVASAAIPAKPWKWLLLAALIGLSGWYLADNVVYALSPDAAKGESLFGRTVWRFGHLLAAVPLLVIAPMQFSRRIRGRWPALHRWSGRVYLCGAGLAAVLAIYLGVTIRYEGSRVPLALFGSLWLAFSVAAWQCARRRDFTAHQRFVVRGYALALAFVWVRVMYDFQAQLFPFIADVDVRDTTREWLSFVVPLLVVESWIAWWPSARRAFAGAPPKASG